MVQFEIRLLLGLAWMFPLVIAGRGTYSRSLVATAAGSSRRQSREAQVTFLPALKPAAFLTKPAFLAG